ncbi:non-ribosomal peptide synthetase [Anaeromicropila populeti]|uniref:Amino acid adenylation domain-containing protein n=1 Tax=Anaeromicropila populeti TaxID=37658 RepID=A0A1I6JAI3_9FIRM|nr:non-ribosomal peptide synthetase [Anaeromicropila populeti]SFR76007.1 amino acid adenylation domain-containing protein [Anaeromicropila populeti]
MEALFDLTNPQKQILEMYSYGGKDVASIFIGIKINYKYEYEILQKAVNELIRRNDAFHLRIVNDNGLIRQKIQRPQKIVLSMKQFHTNEEYEVWASELSKQGLDIYGDLFQVYGFRIEDTFGVYFKFHHLISDGWSVQVVAAQMDEIYKCLLNGVEPQINNGTYADYIISEEQYMAGSKYLRDKLYWEQICEKELPLAQISDKPISSIDAKRMEIILDQEKAKSIRNYSKKHECSLFAFFTTVFGCYLSMLNHQDEIVIGTTFVDRNSRKFKNTIGMFANVIPLLLHINKDNLEDNFKRTQKSIFEAYKHQKYNYNCMAREMNVRNLFLVEINYQIAAKIGSDYYDSVDWFFQHGQNESLIINILDETDETIRINYDYLTCQYTVEEILLLHNHIINIIDEGIAGKEILSYLCEEERHKILKEFNATEAVLPAGKTVIDLFEEQVEKTPGCTAIVCGETKLTYKELNNRINILAQKLREMNVGRGDLVALLTERSIEMVIGIYGIIKAGGAYVPIDPMYPDERIQYILKDCSPKVLLTYGTEINTEIPLLRLEDSISWQGESMNLIKVNKLEDLVYCIYTSGTTGKPKGVMIEHGNLLNYIYYAICNYFHESKVIPLFTNYCFDLTVTTLFGVLLSGAALAIYGNDHDENMKDIFQGNDVTFAKMTPIHLRLAAGGNENKDNQINTLVLGGEELDTVTSNTILKKYGEHIKIHNEYGPTEATVGCCDYVFNTQYDVGKTVCIGKPISNTKIYIMQGERLCGIGVPGELCIAGAGVARGYLNRPELTAEKFIHHPYGEGKMYRTGDLARWLPDGNLEYLGRIDEQVKIRGFRIEPGEIENVIRSMKGIRDCAVVARKEEAGEKALYAYLVSEQELELGEIRSCLLEQLPDYMVPSYMMQIEAIPMTINGKLDKKALPEIKARSRQEYVAPETKLEQKICQIFGEILEVEKVGLRDNFFELGGHSLRATRLVNRLEAEFHQRITLKEFFANPTAERIAGWMEQESKEEYEPIPEAEKKEYYPMSSAQKRIYLVCQMDEAGIAYNMPQGIRLKGDVNPEAVRQALQQVTDRHEILRTEFSMQDGEPVQRIRDQVKADFTYEEDGETRENRLLEEFVRPFDLAQAPLLRTKLVKRREGYVLLMDMHHIIGDGMSVGNYIREISALYNGVEMEKPVKQYKDYSQWMRMRDFTEQKKYWVQQFQDEIPVLDMPLDYNRPKSQSYKGAVIEDKLEERLYEAVRRLAEETGTTEYMIFLSAAMVLLGKYSRQEEIIIGSPISGRVHQDTETMLGVFVNTLAIKGKPEEEKSYEDFLQEIRETCLKAYENQEYPFEELVEEIQVTRDMSRNPLFDVMLVLQNNEEIQVNFDGVETEPVVPESSIAKFDLTFTLYQEKKHCHILLEYSTDLFRKESAERILSHYIKVLEQVLDNRTRRLAEVEVITEEEKKRILKEFNRTDASFPEEKTVIDLFEEQVEKTPEQTAVVCGEKELTYRELNQRVNVLAHKLRQDGVKPGDFVAVMAERSIELIIGIYGILKAGGAYVPVDPGYPEERIQYMLEDCRPKALLTYHCQIETDLPVIDLENCISWKGEEKNPKKVNKPEDTAYCIYTSGTTGKPKGVMNKHVSLVNRLHWMNSAYPLTEQDVILQKTTFTFDVSVWELIWWSLVGARVVMLEPGGEKNPEQICHTIAENHVTVMHFVPSMLNSFMAYIENKDEELERIRSLKQVFSSGEALNSNVVHKFYATIHSRNHTNLVNLYGPTEACIDVTFYDCSGKEEERIIPIGKPIDNTQIYILNEKKLCGIGIPGELCIAGTGVAKGYLNKPELTKEKFIKNPFGAGCLYRTGDLTRWLTDGNIEYLGRMDRQVKIRGLRIELGEIENAIRRISYIKDCAVIDTEDKSGDKVILGYLVSDVKVQVTEIRNILKETLPEYMIPSQMMQVDNIPVTSNGKLDRKALPDIVIKSDRRYIPAQNEKDALLYACCEKVLGVGQFGSNDDFVELGGDSIKALKIATMMQEAGVEITVKEVLLRLLQNI